MNVGQICQHNVFTVTGIDELTTAAQLMREKHIGYLIVVEPAYESDTFKPVGVLTDRDIVISAIARGLDLGALTVGDVMSRDPVMATMTQSIESALQSMRRIGVRRLPVVGYRGELVGVLSLDDVLNTLASELQNIAGAIGNEQLIEGTTRL